ncbi:DUF418 domain-containing protein [Erythrobacter sp.]|uniref:DUF418 domain-containing protein n=1 Tax=Erythrobacter sp. TaxID=1042 RepID=UPI001AFD45D9|nr:DUF418 domain-containing protein [Erythrobacter sp.]MBO6527993.1 DUF418 domain-containing protein [Erythrobacter sp.]MBO6530375.1 DUF418 domain-containing protein [Erythrobacter sp.]
MGRAGETGLPFPRERIVELDALRGIAVIGIAWMNVYVFALPLQAYYNPAAYGVQSAFDYALWAVSFVLVEDKFRTLFAMLFGLGVAIMWERGTGWREHLARMALLFAIGVIHATLLASNDILRVYALAGLALPLLLQLGWHGLGLAMIALVALHLGGGYVWLANRSPEFFALNFGTHPDGLAYALELGRESIGDRIVRRLASLPATLAAISAGVPINLASMLAGVALWKSGLPPSRWSRGRVLGLIVLCCLVALPALALIAFSAHSLAFDPQVVARNALVLSAPFDLLMGVAYAVAMLALFTRIRDSLGVRLLAAAGRLSLTNYLMTSLVFSALFASWGAGLFAAVSRSEALLLSLVPAALMLVWSPLWLRLYGQGPTERLWRAGARAIAGRGA